MMEHSAIDLEVFTQLESMYHALKLSVQDPIVVPNSEVDIERNRIIERLKINITKVYYYVLEEGEDIVKRRIRTHGEDIRTAIQKHQRLAILFHKAELSARRKRRSDLCAHVARICKAVDDYTRFITTHQEKTAEESFLTYPHYIGGNISVRDNAYFILPNFNNERNAAGVQAQTTDLQGLLTDFSLGESLTFKEIYTEKMDFYKNAIELTKFHLEQCGLKQ